MVLASIDPRPGNLPLSLVLVSTCIPRQIPKTGIFSSSTFSFNTSGSWASAILSIAAPKAPTPGSRIFVAAAILSLFPVITEATPICLKHILDRS